MIFIYDNTFEGFLTLVYDVYYKKYHVTKILKELPSTLLLDEHIIIKTDQDNAFKVLDALKEKFQKKYFENILNVFMCDSIDFEVDLLGYVMLGFKNQKELENINHSSVFNIQNYLKGLFRTYHKMSGFVRFEVLEDRTLYAKIDVKYNVLYFLAKHFSKRLNNQDFIIHDIQRELAYIHTSEYVGIEKVASFEEPTLSKDEQKFKTLWKTFFDSITIETRLNPKLQQQMVPLLYRTYMNEFNS
jgi:probable DNA metabolism protein